MTTRVAWLFLLCLLPVLGLADVRLEGVRVWNAPDHTRLVFDIDRPVEHTVFALDDPHRLVIDLRDTRLAGRVDAGSLDSPHIARVRHGKRGRGDLRVVLDLKQPVRPKSFLLKPQEQYGHRLVVDLHGKSGGARPAVTKSVDSLGVPRDVVVAVDAGHGGEDPGAIGPRRTQEKGITLAISRKVKALIDAEPGMRAVLTRDGDYYLGLRRRIAIAREHRADLFVSVHADAFQDSRVHGASVYVLSRRGASSEAARWLAAQENSADLVGGVSLDDKDDVLASVLLDLSQSATQQASQAAARRIYKQLGNVGKVHGNRVQRAGFVVLKSPDIPSVLVETGFISNPGEERRLADSGYQKRIAEAIVAGIRDHFREEPPPGTLLAQQRPRKHVIRPGDTLSEIAERYQVSLNLLREQNRIDGDRIRIGQVLTIPGG
jgi:N-acetylmuramoyl-L-alanine amidase